MIDPVAADVLRWTNGGLALTLMALAGFAIVVSEFWDQRTRFGLFAAFGALLTAGHLSALGDPGSYRLPILTVIIILAVISTAAYVRREWALFRARSTMHYTAGGPNRDARAGHVPVSGPGPAAGSTGNLGGGTSAAVGDLSQGVAPPREDHSGLGGTRLPTGGDSEFPGYPGAGQTEDPGAPRR
jgi:hypothetical protein